jgi:hypothetical protein
MEVPAGSEHGEVYISADGGSGNKCVQSAFSYSTGNRARGKVASRNYNLLICMDNDQGVYTATVNG